MLVVGLTGNYGMGKSSVLEMFKEFGAATVSADEIVRSLLDEKSVLDIVRAKLGADVFSEDGRLDRAKAASVIFRDEGKRKEMEDVLHPLVFQRVEDFIEKESERDYRRMVVVEIPLMFERKYSKRFHKTVTVYADERVVLERLGRSGVASDDILARLDAQMAISEKVRLSDFAINNNGTIDDTKTQVKRIYERLKNS